MMYKLGDELGTFERMERDRDMKISNFELGSKQIKPDQNRSK